MREGLVWSTAAAVVAAAGGALATHAYTRYRQNQSPYGRNIDPLTGAGNRNALQEAADKVLADIERISLDGSRGPALLLLDLDGFRDVNDILGHPAGDAVLAQVAHQLRSAAGPKAVVTRMGGDEFAVLFPDPLTASQATLQAKKLLAAFGASGFQADNVSLDIRASIGISLAPQHGRDLDELLRHADLALNEAKQRRSGVHLYTPEIDPRSLDSAGTLAQVRGAMDSGQLQLRFQPVVSAEAGKLTGFEALVRWQHPQRGLLLPAEFVPLVERTSLIHPLTRWVTLTACKQGAQWRQRGLDITMAVNISAVTLEEGLLGIVDEALALTRFPADQLVFEFTESAITLNPDAAQDVARGLRERGVKVSVDDFGAGFTCLGILADLKADTLKIDRQFVERLGEPSHDSIVSSIIDLAHRLDLSVIAEGVETAEVAERLTALGCDEFQGYYFARPMDKEAAFQWALANGQKMNVPVPHQIRPASAG